MAHATGRPHRKTTLIRMLPAIAAAALLWLQAPAASASDAGPREVIRETVDAVIARLQAREDRDRLTAADRAAIHDIVDAHFDYGEMAMRSLGRPWRNMDAAQREEFTRLFRDLLEHSYGNRLAAYDNQRVEYAEAEFRRDKARVRTTVIDGEKRIPVEYRLHEEGRWLVYDIRIEGVSLVSTFRTEFRQIVERDGVEGLLESLRNKIARRKDEGGA